MQATAELQTEKNPLGFAIPENIPSYEEVKELLKTDLIHCFTDFFNHNQISQMVDAFYRAKPDWTTGFGVDPDDGIDYTQNALGSVWYYYAEGKANTNAYYRDAPAGRAAMERHIPGLENYILDFLKKFHGTEKVDVRKGWAGPGIVHFPAHNGCAQNGGPVHFDLEGLPGIDVRDPSLETYSFVAMLQKPESGGDLLVWDIPYDHSKEDHRANDLDNDDFPDALAKRIDYKLTEMWMFSGKSPHRITGFEGDTDRLCLTFHTLKRNDTWECWL